ncbi:MAG TPA: GGDEF domain-containing protein, partial [Acidovorax defluvii]|nr:GGDEF domain-containing protein [Acidovorax defluvii]
AEGEGDGVMLFLDLDYFTVVNDVAGHDAGDDVLRHVARLLESQVRQIGWAARLGGDEFAVVLPGCSLARGQALAEQLRAAVQAWEPSYQGRSFTLGVSIGLVVLDASLQDVPSVLYAADMACYDAKRAGRNRVETRHADQAAASGRMALGPV